MPAGLEIDNETPIANNIAPYTSHILIATGQVDWTSRIEDAHEDLCTKPWGDFISHIKTAFGRNGPYHSDSANVLVTASSLPSPPQRRSLLLFPAHEEISIPAPSPDFEADPALDALLPYLAARSTETNESLQIQRTPLTHPTILICSHNSRDSRCGILGPLLHAEFERHLSSRPSPRSGIRTAMVSHVGGHKWAGNVIIYIPLRWPLKDGGDTSGEQALSSLVGKAVWYGRVEPRHVEGIIKETVYGGKVIGELCRGVVDRDGRLLRI
jgi:hypothetical protein